MQATTISVFRSWMLSRISQAIKRLAAPTTSLKENINKKGKRANHLATLGRRGERRKEHWTDNRLRAASWSTSSPVTTQSWASKLPQPH